MFHFDCALNIVMGKKFILRYCVTLCTVQSVGRNSYGCTNSHDKNGNIIWK